MNKETLGGGGPSGEKNLSIGEKYQSAEARLTEIEEQIERVKAEMGQRGEGLPKEVLSAQELLRSAEEDPGSVSTQEILEAQKVIRSYAEEHPELEEGKRQLETLQQARRMTLREMRGLISESVRPHVKRAKSFIEMIDDLANLGRAGDSKRRAWQEVYSLLAGSKPLPQGELAKRLEGEREKKNSVLQNLTEEEWQEFLPNCASLQLGIQVIKRAKARQRMVEAKGREDKMLSIVEKAKNVERFGPWRRSGEVTFTDLLQEAKKTGFLIEVPADKATLLITNWQNIPKERRGPVPVIEINQPDPNDPKTKIRSFYTYPTEPDSLRFIDRPTKKVWEALLKARRRCIEKKEQRKQEKREEQERRLEEAESEGGKKEETPPVKEENSTPTEKKISPLARALEEAGLVSRISSEEAEEEPKEEPVAK